MADSLHDRFWSFVTKTDGCWLWTGRSLNHGYGQYWVNGKRWIASRLAWHLTYGHIPANQQVCHKCDLPQCVRPDHLYLASQVRNLEDMRQKGRGKLLLTRQGSANNKAKLTIAQVRDIQTLRQQGCSWRRLGKHYGVCHTTIAAAVIGRTWKHIT